MPTDFAAARALLAEAGFPGGRGCPKFEVQVRNDELHAKVLEVIQALWQRELGITLPVYIGMPGKVSRTKLLELSARIGVGPSLDFLRKQRGIRALLSRGSTSDKLYDALAPALDDPRLNLAGFHIFTFNQLTDTFEWERAKEGTNTRHSAQSSAPRLYVQAEKRSQ